MNLLLVSVIALHCLTNKLFVVTKKLLVILCDHKIYKLPAVWTNIYQQQHYVCNMSVILRQYTELDRPVCPITDDGMTVKGFPSLLQVLRPFDRSMDWIPEEGSPDIVPTNEEALRAWLHVVPILPTRKKGLSRQLRVMYNPKTLEAPSGRVEIRVQGMLENANLHPIGELKK